MREDAFGKGRRLLTEGRLIVQHVGEHRIIATCRGDSGEVYHLGLTTRRWNCDCPALGKCSHLTALQLVCVRQGTP